jgi:hypothetical protein
MGRMLLDHKGIRVILGRIGLRRDSVVIDLLSTVKIVVSWYSVFIRKFFLTNVQPLAQILLKFFDRVIV